MNLTLIRRYLPADREAILALKDRRGPEFPFCDPDNSGPCTQPYVAVKDGTVVALAFGHIVVDGFMVVDPVVPPLERFEIIKELIRLGIAETGGMGAQEMQLHIPADLGRYAQRLEEIGFLRTGKTHMVIGTMPGDDARGTGGR